MRISVVTTVVSERLDEEILEYLRYFRTKNVSLQFIEDFLTGKEVVLDTYAGELLTKVRFKLDPPALHLLKRANEKDSKIRGCGSR